MSVLLRLLFLGGLFVASVGAAVAAVEITESEYEGRPQFKISTPAATWYYDKAGGGFSRLIDREGRDWIGFHREPLNQSPASAAAGYRGLPNAIFGKDNADAGAGHPGFDLCETSRVRPDVVRTVSKSGRWAWSWYFTETYAVFTMEKADASTPWWFLYEGPVAGRFLPGGQYWGTDLGGPRGETPDHKKSEDIVGRWRWAYFGDRTVERILFLASTGRASFAGVFSYFGSTKTGLASPDGMVVFGFGRSAGSLPPSIIGVDQKFIVGLNEGRISDEATHRRFVLTMEQLTSTLP